MTTVVSAGVAAATAGLLAAACAPGASGPPVTARDGQELFELRALGGEPGCVTCHSRRPDVVLVGPSLADPASSAARAGVDDPADYVRMSIIDPTAYSVPGFEDGQQMPEAFAEILDPGQIDALVDFLLEPAP